MKIVIAPDSFKGSLSAEMAAGCMERGIKRVIPDCETISVPLADGGEGTTQAVVSALGGDLVTIQVKNPLFEDIDASYGLAGDTAVIEMSAASGITLIPKEKLNPMKTTTFGTGQMMLDALKRGCKRLLIGIGGSATNDGGMGMAAALGVSFLDKQGNKLFPCGETLKDVDRIDMSGLTPLLAEAQVLVACDVTNPVCGERGAARVFAPQKGATPEMVEILDENLHHFCEKIEETLRISLFDLEGGGAAGGLGAGLYSFCNAQLKKGFPMIADAVGLREKMAGADLVLTGEGCTDFQTAFGKLPCGVGMLAKERNIPCVLISGSVKGDISSLYKQGITAAFSSVTSVMELEYAMEYAEVFLERTTENVMRLFLGGK